MTKAQQAIIHAQIDENFNWNTDVSEMSRAEYLTWVAEWKAAYKTLGNTIRRIKRMRPMRDFIIIAKSPHGKRRKTMVGDNPNFDPSAPYVARRLSLVAYYMLIARSDAKPQAKLAAETARDKAA